VSRSVESHARGGTWYRCGLSTEGEMEVPGTDLVPIWLASFLTALTPVVR
jgi:hypothetical protein